MNIMCRVNLLLAFLLVVSISFGQKYGHLNYGNLLAEMEEVKKADAELVTLREAEEASYAKKATAFQNNYNALVEKADSGNLTALQIQQGEADLKKEQETLTKLQQEIQNKIVQKRAELIQPIVDKVNKAIEEVGQDNGLMMIFDVSLGTVLFVKESQDVTDLVKKKMGL